MLFQIPGNSFSGFGAITQSQIEAEIARRGVDVEEAAPYTEPEATPYITPYTEPVATEP